MIITKDLINIEDVPVEWIFEYYLNLTEKLTGQDVKITSKFNPEEKNPSFYVYVNKDREYRYKDFSTDRGGNGIALVQELQSISYSNATKQICEDYESWLKNNTPINRIIKPKGRFTLVDYQKRGWTELDKQYWLQYNISSNLLKQYNVYPLETYKLCRNKQIITIQGDYIYGYFKNDGVCYKIYQPKNEKKKFLKLHKYIQGSEQLDYKQNILIITKALKDILSLTSLNLNIEILGCDSENTLLSKQSIDFYKTKYTKIITLFDNDLAGINAMNKYKEIYNLPFIHVIELSKDVSDSIKDFGIQKTKKIIEKYLHKIN